MLHTRASVSLKFGAKVAMQPFHCLTTEHCFVVVLVVVVVVCVVCNTQVCALLTSSYKCLQGW